MLFSKIIKKKFDEVLGRYDGDPAYHYDSAADFDGLQAESFDVQSEYGWLKGNYYYYGTFKPENLIVFDHGIGAGHLAYLKEIEYLAKNGYTVYSYDHTGCVSSSGTGILGFAQGINDLDHVLDALKKKYTVHKIIGHSWGGYSCMNVCALHSEITHVVSLAGFLSARTLVEQYIPKMFLKYSEEVMERERIHNPKYADMDARESLLKSDAKVMHLQSRDDVKVKFELCTEPMKKALEGRKNIEYVIVDGKNHDPQRTKEAAKANLSMLDELNLKRKKKQLNAIEFRKSHDWNLITQQDDEIWTQILTFLEK